MSPRRFVPYMLKQVTRHRVRSLLTLLGIATAMLLFTAVQAMQPGVARATTASATDTTLVVYRKDRFCPATSVLPQDYARRIAGVDGVVSAIPMKIVVTNCRTSLDVVTFRGVPKELFLADRADAIRVIEGSTDDWLRRTDASLLGETLARRRARRPVSDPLADAGLEPLDEIIVVGVVAPRPDPSVLTVLASGLYVVR